MFLLQGPLRRLFRAHLALDAAPHSHPHRGTGDFASGRGAENLGSLPRAPGPPVVKVGGVLIIVEISQGDGGRRSGSPSCRTWPTKGWRRLTERRDRGPSHDHGDAGDVV
jgi:hypothetical protein